MKSERRAWGCRGVSREQHGGSEEVKGQGSRHRAIGGQPLTAEKLWTPYEDSGIHTTTVEVSSCDGPCGRRAKYSDHLAIPEVCGSLV